LAELVFESFLIALEAGAFFTTAGAAFLASFLGAAFFYGVATFLGSAFLAGPVAFFGAAFLASAFRLVAEAFLDGGAFLDGSADFLTATGVSDLPLFLLCLSTDSDLGSAFLGADLDFLLSALGADLGADLASFLGSSFLIGAAAFLGSAFFASFLGSAAGFSSLTGLTLGAGAFLAGLGAALTGTAF
jgi:hypothetical protein